MALDAYVMPLWRFKAGDFTSPIEETLGIKPTVISLAEPPPPTAPWYLRLLAKVGIIDFIPPPPEPNPEERRAASVREVDALKAQLTKMVGTPIDWPDEGRVHYNKQFHEPVTMRAFAAWLDHRNELPEFASPLEQNYYKHPVWSLPKPAKRRFPTLVEHSLHTGYLLPVPFEGNYKVEPFKIMDHWEFFHFVASSQTIMREATDFLEFLSTVPAANEQEPGPIPFRDIRWYAEELKRMCSLSIEHRLPVIFYG
jgi:hypothetical protein